MSVLLLISLICLLQSLNIDLGIEVAFIEVCSRGVRTAVRS